MQMQDPSGFMPENSNTDSVLEMPISKNGNLSIPAIPPFTQDASMLAPPDDIQFPKTNELEKDSSSDAMIRDVLTPIPIRMRNMSGSYIGDWSSYRMQLRIDVDGTSRLNKVSFDFFSVGSTVNYISSHVVDFVSITTTASSCTIKGNISRGTTSLGSNRIEITIPRRSILLPAAAATLTFFSGNIRNATYVCNFNSSYFRNVLLETDVETGTTLAGDYNTGTFVNPSANRILNVVKAFQEAGIGMNYTGRNNTINTAESGADSKWTDAEMHASMVRHFSTFRNTPQWAVWLLAARRATSSSLLGIMFDYTGAAPHRQGCAVFQDTLRNYFSGSDYNRNQLYTYVHELGHAFNLLHSWDKSRPDSLSWMNYPWAYDQRNGAGRFWENFGFNFDNGELIHLRHAYYRSIIMGGNNWAVGAALESPESADNAISTDVIENNTGLALEIEPVKTVYKLGEPVVIEIKLRNMTKMSQEVNSHIHPKFDFVRIGIKDSNGIVKQYEHIGHYLTAEDKVILDQDNDTLYASAYIGYGKDGFYFAQAGTYTLKAAFKTNNGSIIQSEEVSIRVKTPLNEMEDEIADIYLKDEVGMQFTLLGSDSPELASGLELLKKVSEKYSKNELSVYADLIIGANKAMVFKSINPDSKSIEIRNRNTKQAEAYMNKVFDKSKGESGVDNITLNWAFRQLATAYFRENKNDQAATVLNKMSATFGAKDLRAQVMVRIDQQANSVMLAENK